jgi:hypothetical protein
MRTVLTNEALTDAYLHWLGEQTRTRYLRSIEREEDMGKHSHPDDVETDGIGSYISARKTTAVLRHRGYQCEGCKGYWAALEPVGSDEPEEVTCLATKGCEGPVVALYPTDEPVPDWIPVIIQGGKA